MDDISPEITQVGSYDAAAEEEEDKDLCRICRSPEEPGNPLRYPCACRGSIKYVHQDCIHLWVNRRGDKQCEVCGRSYSFEPVYSENAPERLPCNEFLIGVSVRLARYLKLIVPWIVVILFNTYCVSLHPCGQYFAAEFKSDFGMSRKFGFLWAGLLYSVLLACFMTIITLIRMDFGDLDVMRLPGGFLADNFIGNGLREGVIGGVLQVLWKYMKILCDWYLYKLIHFLGQRRRLIFLPPNVPLHEFGVIRRLLFFLDDDAFAALAISVTLSTLFVLLPLSIGWIVLATVGGSYLSEKSPVILGYMMMLSVSFAYFGILYILLQNSFSAIVRWFLLGLYSITVTLPCLLLGFLVKACKKQFFIKDAFVLYFKIGALPWIIGFWLEICASPMFGTKKFQIFGVVTHIPYTMMAIRYFSGFGCLTIADAYRERIQQIIHKRAFWYLLDVTDPDYKITKLNLGHTFFVFASHGVLLVILFHLPIRAITLISPSFFPLELWATDENLSIFAPTIYLNLMQFGLQWLIELTRPALKLIVHNWIITVSSWLKLSDFLLLVPQGEGFHRADQNVGPMMQPISPYDDNPWFLLYSLAEGSMVILYEPQNAEDDIEEQRDNRYLPRIAIMLMLGALSLFLVSTAFMALPILVGRVFFDSVTFMVLRFRVKHDDICAFWIGCYILRAIYISTCFAFDHIWTGRTNFLVKYILIRIRNGLVFSIWISIIPGLLGLLIDLMIIIPLRVPLHESPVYLLILDWLIGVVVLHIWTILTLLTPIKCFATKAWRRKFERIRNVGINKVPSMWLLRDVIGSIINTLLTTLSVPYLFVKSLFPLLGCSESVNAAVERFIWPASLALIAVWFMTELTREIIIYFHQLIFNERYLVGERVGDLTEDL